MLPSSADHEERKAKMNFRVRPSMWAETDVKKEDSTFFERTSRALKRRQRRASYMYGLRIFHDTKWDAVYDQGGRVGITGYPWYPIGTYKAPRDRAGQESRWKARSVSMEEDCRPRVTKVKKLRNPFVRLRRRKAAVTRSSPEGTPPTRHVSKRRRIGVAMEPEVSSSASPPPVADMRDIRVKTEPPTEEQSQADWGGASDDTPFA